ncbi:MAG: DNA methyltransferase, partial [Pseudolabrys sp.]
MRPSRSAPIEPFEPLPLFGRPRSGAAAARRPTKGAGKSFFDEIRQFREFGAQTRRLVEAGIPYFVNEFWTAGQRQAHSLHEVSYRACFKAQLPEFFIARLTAEGDTVYDPFMGRGTTPIQAGLMNRRVVGNDINPLSVLLARPRLNPPRLDEVAKRLRQIPWDAGQIERDDLLAFYHPATLRQLNALRAWL